MTLLDQWAVVELIWYEAAYPLPWWLLYAAPAAVVVGVLWWVRK